MLASARNGGRRILTPAPSSRSPDHRIHRVRGKGTDAPEGCTAPLSEMRDQERWLVGWCPRGDLNPHALAGTSTSS